MTVAPVVDGAACPEHAPRPVPVAPQGCVASSDALKDLDCVGFVYALAPADQPPWLEWMRRIRIADRRAETDLAGLLHLKEAWGTVREFEFHDGTPRQAATWALYLDALAEYHRPALVIRTLAEHDEMLLRLSGPLLQLAPGMPEELWEAAAHFGALDQFYNNLRDLAEDAERGLCWIPEEVLERHGLSRDDVITGRAPDKDGWRNLMTDWIHISRVELRRRALRLLTAEALQPPLVAMLAWTEHRHQRIIEAFLCVRRDYRRFPERYWAEVRRELGGRADDGRAQ